MKEYRRKQLLERIGRDGATVGRSIPEQIEIQDQEIDLQAFVFEIQRRETIPPGERDRVEQAKRNLRRERRERKRQIEDGEISYEKGEQLAEAIVGIDRALTELESLGSVDIEREAEASETADRKRWLQFLRKALGDEPDSR